MFLKTLTLEDFQSHEKSVFNFDKGLNILTGLSNAGIKVGLDLELSIVKLL
jgi:recombinational DNA repair ATPase RecF